jgi:hypothetical protein
MFKDLGQANPTPSLSHETMESLYSILDLCQSDADFDVKLSILHEITDRQETLNALVPRLVDHLPVLCMSAIWSYLKEYTVPDVTCDMIHSAFARYGYYMFNDVNCTVEYFKQQTTMDNHTWPITDPYDYTTLDRRPEVLSLLGKLVQREIDKGSK